MSYKIDSGDIKGFVLGVIASITAVIVWDMYKKRKGTLEYGEQKVIDEVKSAIQGLKNIQNEQNV
jgi:hypothetical protein